MEIAVEVFSQLAFCGVLPFKGGREGLRNEFTYNNTSIRVVNEGQGFCGGASLLNSKNSSKGRGFKPWLGSADENPKRSKHPSTHSGLLVELILSIHGIEQQD